MILSVVLAFGAGILFATGLVISGMTNPHVVTGFLDVFGTWDASLVFVMLGAVSFNFLSFKFLATKKPLCAPKHFWPDNKNLDKKLLLGSAIFGIGWGTIGVCPGPGIVNLMTFKTEAVLFVAAMIVGMLLFKVTDRPQRKN